MKNMCKGVFVMIFMIDDNYFYDVFLCSDVDFVIWCVFNNDVRNCFNIGVIR